MAVQVHPTAVVDKRANLDQDIVIGPYSIIGPDVVLGSGTTVGPHVVIEGKTIIGKKNTIFQFASLGGPPQHLQFKGEDVRLEIGDGNVFREYVNINLGTIQGRGFTKIGNNNFIMSQVHIGHDCQIGNNVTIATGAGLAGHVVVEDHVFIGGITGVSQRVRIGTYAYIGGCTGIGRDVPPYTLGRGANAISIKGINVIGLQRNGFPEETILALRRAFRTVFLSDHTVQEGCDIAIAQLGSTPEVAYFISFIRESKQGIASPNARG